MYSTTYNNPTPSVRISSRFLFFKKDKSFSLPPDYHQRFHSQPITSIVSYKNHDPGRKMSPLVKLGYQNENTISFSTEDDEKENKRIQQVLLHAEAYKIYEENKNDNWDGYDAIGINNEQLEYATHFINKIFNSHLSEKVLKLIEIDSENYGNIAFDWFVDHDHQISISIRDSKAIFTYKFNKNKIYGEIPLNEDLTPIINLIQTLYE